MALGWRSRRRYGSGGRLRPALRELRFILLLALFLGLAFVFLPRPIDWVQGEPVRVEDVWRVHVIDGDTFRYGGETIRIAGIDAPEIRPARCEQEAELGAKATARLHELLRAGPFEMAPVAREEDKYQRKLRRVLRNGRSLGGVLISEGLARPLDGARRPWC